MLPLRLVSLISSKTVRVRAPILLTRRAHTPLRRIAYYMRSHQRAFWKNWLMHIFR
jgi:hypothetical protein